MNDAAIVTAPDMTTSTVARVLDCSEGTVRNMARRGELPSVLLSSGMRLYHRDDVARVRAARRANRAAAGIKGR